MILFHLAFKIILTTFPNTVIILHDFFSFLLLPQKIKTFKVRPIFLFSFDTSNWCKGNHFKWPLNHFISPNRFFCTYCSSFLSVCGEYLLGRMGLVYIKNHLECSEVSHLHEGWMLQNLNKFYFEYFNYIVNSNALVPKLSSHKLCKLY